MTVPPAGRPLAFGEFTEVVTRRMRAFLPEIAAARRGAKTVIWRYGTRTAEIHDDGGSYWVRFREEDRGVGMASLYTDRKDHFVSETFARSILGYFDARFAKG
jgi:hypothetical protein